MYLAPCKSLARHDPESEELIVEALPIFINSLRRMAFHVDIMFWSPASVARIMKYVAKGFECVVPGIRRSAFKTETANRGLDRFCYGRNRPLRHPTTTMKWKLGSVARVRRRRQR